MGKFLKSLGQALLKGVTIFNNPVVRSTISVGETMLASAVPGAAPIISEINQIAGAVVQAEVTVEAIKAAHGDTALTTGAMKLQAATPLVRQVIMASQLLDGNKIADQDAFNKACEGITSNFADLLNSIEKK